MNIGFLKGTVLEAAPDSVVLEVHGVGYQLQVPLPALADLAVGAAAELWVQTVVREDAILLFGFRTRAEREWFRLLTSVSGIGPKLGLNILSLFPPERLYAALVAADLDALSGVPKVGKKTAERMVIELRDKVKRLRPAGAAGGAAAPAGGAESAGEALVALGFERAAARTAVEAVLAADPAAAADVKQLVTAALRRLQR